MTRRWTGTSRRSRRKFPGASAEVLVHDNEPVKAGQVLVKIDPRDYQAALDNAKAALALAESEAQSAKVDVPARGKTWRVEIPTRARDCWARKQIWRKRKPHIRRRKIRIWRTRRPMWKRPGQIRNWRRRIWSVTAVDG